MIRKIRTILSGVFLAAALTGGTAPAIRQGELRTERYVYTGGVTDGKQNGYGVCRYTNGNVYYGYWNMGYKDGLGRLEYADGTIEFGRWRSGRLPKERKQRFKPGQQVYGIDVSKHQKTFDWTKLALRARADGTVRRGGKSDKFLQPVLFALMKSTEGVTVVDPTFKRNFAQAKRCGIVRGAYHFLSVTSDVDEQVKSFIANTPLEAGDFPPVLDLEIDRNVMARQHAKVCAMAKKWLTLIEKHYGVKPIIYTYENYYKEYLKGQGFDSYDFWIARYGKEPSARRWEIWQFTDKGRVACINHKVDIDLFRGDYRELKKYIKDKGIKER